MSLFLIVHCNCKLLAAMLIFTFVNKSFLKIDSSNKSNKTQNDVEDKGVLITTGSLVDAIVISVQAV